MQEFALDALLARCGWVNLSYCVRAVVLDALFARCWLSYVFTVSANLCLCQ